MKMRKRKVDATRASLGRVLAGPKGPTQALTTLMFDDTPHPMHSQITNDLVYGWRKAMPSAQSKGPK